MLENQPRDKLLGQAAAALGIVMVLSLLALITHVVPAPAIGWVVVVAALCLFGVICIGLTTLKGPFRIVLGIVLFLVLVICVLTLLGPSIGRSSSGP
jgi:hypothetical protein